MKKTYNKPGFTVKSNSDKPHVYCTINKVNGKVYVGATKGTDPNYIGSGTAFEAAKKKYGKENFVKTILSEFNDVKDAFLFEGQIVNKEFISHKWNYNMKVGGEGGFSDACYEALRKWQEENPEAYLQQKRDAYTAALATGNFSPEKGAKLCLESGNHNFFQEDHGKNVSKRRMKEPVAVRKEKASNAALAAIASPNSINKQSFTCPRCNLTKKGPMWKKHVSKGTKGCPIK